MGQVHEALIQNTLIQTLNSSKNKVKKRKKKEEVWNVFWGIYETVLFSSASVDQIFLSSQLYSLLFLLWVFVLFLSLNSGKACHFELVWSTFILTSFHIYFLFILSRTAKNTIIQREMPKTTVSTVIKKCLLTAR